MNEDDTHNDDIDVRQIIKDLLTNKRSIIGAIIISVVMAVLVAFLIPRSYEGKGFFSMSNVKLPQYRKYKTLFEDIDLLKNYISQYYDTDEWSVQNSIFEDSFEPFFSYGEDEEEDVLLDNIVLGVYITSTASEPEIAKERVRTLGDYISTTIVNVKMYSYFLTLRGELESAILESTTTKLHLEDDKDDYLAREALISDGLIGLYNRDVYERQVVQVTALTEKYLPPHQQLVATRVHLNNIGLQLEKLDLKIARDNAMLAFADKIEKYFVDKNEFIINKSLHAQINEEFKKFFADEGIKQTNIKSYYAMQGKILGFRNLKNGSLFFVTDPFLPNSSGSPRKSSVAILIFFIILGTYMGYEVFKSWWNQDA